MSLNTAKNPNAIFPYTYTTEKLLAGSGQIPNAPESIKPKLKLLDNWIIINSCDRDWYGNSTETPYKFNINFGGVSSSNPQGTDIIYNGSQYSTITKQLRNIYSISADKIILSNRFQYSSYASNSIIRFTSNPYVALLIKNITFTGVGTNTLIDSCLAVFTPFTPIYETISDVRYLEFKNANLQRKEYLIVPEGNIPLLEIELKNANNEILGVGVKDVITVTNITPSISITTPLPAPAITEYIKLATEFFTDSEFKVGDTIIIKGYSYHNLAWNTTGNFNNFINRQSGHIIIGIDKSDSGNILYDIIRISAPININRTTGELIRESWYEIFLTHFVDSGSISGVKMINTNTQTHVMMNIKTVVKDDNNMFLNDI